MLRKRRGIPRLGNFQALNIFATDIHAGYQDFLGTAMRTLYSPSKRGTPTMSFYRIQEYGGSAARKLSAVDAQNRNDSEYNDDNDESSAA